MLRRIRGLVTVATSLLVGSACQPSAEEAKELLQHYREDSGARTKMLNECQENAGFIRKDPECLIAREALRQEGRGSLRDLPPIGLSDPKRESHPTDGGR
jgi:hypothetical protein